MTIGSTASAPSSSTERSARRQTVRARCSAAPAGQPSDEDEVTQRRDLRVELIDPALEPRDAVLVDDDLLDPLGDAVRRIGEPRAEREQIALQRQAHLVEVVRQLRRRAPRRGRPAASSTSP